VTLQTVLFVYVCSKCSIIEPKKRFETWVTINDVNGVSLYNPSYLITLMAYLCSQRTPNVQINYFMFDWSTYRLLVLNTGWKCDSQQMVIFVNICSTCSVVELKKQFETFIAINEINGVHLYHFYYIVTVLKLVTYLTSAHNGYQLSKSVILWMIS
jgi:hypothetical protein